MSAGVSRMPLAAKVNAFQREVGSYECFVSGRNIKHGAIVADSVEHACKRGSTAGLCGL
jgi:hypothetical protein